MTAEQTQLTCDLIRANNSLNEVKHRSLLHLPANFFLYIYYPHRFYSPFCQTRQILAEQGIEISREGIRQLVFRCEAHKSTVNATSDAGNHIQEGRISIEFI